MKKQIGLIGLGKMGSLMAENLLKHKYKVVVNNRSKEPINKAKKKGATPAYTLKELTEKLETPRVIIVMITAGKPIDNIIKSLTPLLSKNDIIIDAGNSYYEDSIKRYKKLKKININYIDMGTSGGLTGAQNGASLMIGGDKKVFKKIEQLFKDLSVKNGYAYLGESGAGHYVKTIHNGIEYSILESYAEGYGILNKSKYNLNLREVSRVWSNGSVIRSWITELAQKAFKQNTTKLTEYKGIIGGGQTGKWALQIAKKQKCDVHTLEHALRKRKKSKTTQSFPTKFVSAIRNQFGGHEEP